MAENNDNIQFAYKGNRSTCDAVATLAHTILESLDSGCCSLNALSWIIYCRSIWYLVNSLSHFFQKLERQGGFFCRLSSYFRDRKQYTYIDGAKSSLVSNNCSVLQGVVLSPFLFSLLLKDLQSPNSCSLFKYSDD